MCMCVCVLKSQMAPLKPVERQCKHHCTQRLFWWQIYRSEKVLTAWSHRFPSNPQLYCRWAREHTHTHMHTHTHSHTHTHARTYTHTHTCTHIHTHARTYTHTHTYTQSHTHMHAHTHRHTHRHTHTYTQSHTHTCTHIHTVTHTHTHSHTHTSMQMKMYELACKQHGSSRLPAAIKYTVPVPQKSVGVCVFVFREQSAEGKAQSGICFLKQTQI